MTVSVASTTIRYSRKSGVYTTEIISPSGDLVQYYKGDEHNPGDIYQDFGKMKPILYLMTMSSRANEGKGGRVTHNGVDIYVNNKLFSGIVFFTVSDILNRNTALIRRYSNLFLE